MKSYNLFQVWNELEAKLVGEFTEDQTEREKVFKANLDRFQDRCRDIVNKHKEARWAQEEFVCVLVGFPIKSVKINSFILFS